MRNLIQTTFFILAIILGATSIKAQNNYPFEGNRSIKITNPFTSSDQVTLSFRVKSTSTSMYAGHGSYARILGGSGYFIELADVKGKLAYYNGAAWRNVDVDLRKEEKNIFLVYDKGMLKIYVGDQLVSERSHRSTKFHCPYLFIGSSFRNAERFIGYMDYFAIHNRVLTTKEMSDISKGTTSKIVKTNPGILYNFEEGVFYPNGINSAKQKLDLNIGKKNKGKGEIVEVEEEVVDYEPQPIIQTIKMEVVKKTNGIFAGRIKKNKQQITPGKYDLIVKPNGTIEIREKIEMEKN